LVLFKSFCLCFYNIALRNISGSELNKFRLCYTKCVKMFLGFTKYYTCSVTNILLLAGLPSFDTLMINAKKSDAARWSSSSNALVKSLL